MISFSRKIRLATVLVLGFALAPAVQAAGGKVELVPAEVNVNDVASLQSGAQLYVNYCIGCHSLNFMRYNRLAADLDLSEEMVEANLMFTDAKFGDPMTNTMNPEDAAQWFGKAPPDLSLVGRSRGADWIFNYLISFYRDDNGGWNNTILENAAMPHVLWPLQGIQEPVYETVMEGDLEVIKVAALELVEPGVMSEEEYLAAMRDLTAFLDYVGEPIQLKRKKIGVWVMAFLAFFAFLAYLLKAEYWRDVH
jgi:ubiquinol-cytochrome c reductase cytochrome c1 subunit